MVLVSSTLQAIAFISNSPPDEGRDMEGLGGKGRREQEVRMCGHEKQQKWG